MSKLRFSCALVVCCVCFATFACFARTATTQEWPVYKGDMRSYFMSHLPLPFVIYKYNTKGALVGMFIAPKFHKNKGNTPPTVQDRAYLYKKMRQFIISGNVKQPSQQELATYAAAFKEFLLDQGYDLDSLIDHTKTYTLVLAETDVSKTTCPLFRNAHSGNLDTVRLAIKDATTAHSYAVKQLVVGGPGLTFGACSHE